MLSGDQFDAWIEAVERNWGTSDTVRFWVPTKANDEAFRRGWARWERQGGSPSMAIALSRMNQEVDIRHILPAIRVPTLLLHRLGDTRVNIEAARYLAARIPDSRLVELPGVDHVPFDITDRIVEEIEEFLTGSRHDVQPDRVLATVLFTDIVDSTKRAAALGDRACRQLLDRHDAAAREEIAHFRGRAVKHLGDGLLATFDGPARGVRCAAAIAARVRPIGIEVRNGLHTGEIEMAKDDIAGIAVHTAARIAEMAGTGEILVSSTVRDLVAGSGLSFEDRGAHPLKGLPELMRLFRAAV